MNLRRRNLTCFYCGCRSAQKHSTGLSQWRCEQCEAVNHLDQNGQITDPPASSTPVSKPASGSLRYAHAPVRPLSPPPFAATSSFADDLFCQTCLKNQHFYRENLASYLPSEDSPKYNEYVKAYDKYKEDLEKRYPQVCATCAPRVRQQIKNSAYVAKTDHLRRMVEKTRTGGGDSRRRGGWRAAVIRLGAVGWAFANCTQILWHALEILEQGERTFGLVELGNSASFLRSPLALKIRGIASTNDFEGLHASTSRMMPWALLAGVLASWWNPWMHKKYLGSGGTMVGLGNYYRSQLISLTVRAGAWWILTYPFTNGFSYEELLRANAFMMVFMTLTTIYSSTLVKLDSSSRVSFQVSDAMLPEATHSTDGSVSHSINQPWQPNIQPFPISNLAPAPTPYMFPSNEPQPQPQSTPFYPIRNSNQYREPSEADADMMDWTPSSTPIKAAIPFNPARPRIPLQPLPSGPSPFHGSLPATPASPAHLLRRPPNMAPGVLRKTTEREQENFLAAMTTSQRRGGVASEGDEDERETSNGGAGNGRARNAGAEMKMAPARFFLKEDTVDTGLEAMFDEVFSIRDEPAAVGTRRAGGEGDDGSQGQGGPSFGQRLGGLLFGR